MNKWKYIFIVFLFCQCSALLDSPLLANTPNILPAHNQIASKKNPVDKKVHLKKYGVLANFIVKNKRRAALVKMTGGNGMLSDKQSKPLFSSYFFDGQCLTTDKDCKFKSYLIHNYPSHNFW